MIHIARVVLPAVAALLFNLSAHAVSVDVNKASQSELEGVKGIGPGMSVKILAERKKGHFRDWNDLVDRIPGVGPGNAAKFSTQGLTVNGAGYSAVTASAMTVGAPHRKGTAQGVITTHAPLTSQPLAGSGVLHPPKAAAKGATEATTRK
ncbi:MAG: helix-hairpin-helix domain-containing protein [Pseudomonadota bacterium]